MLIIQETGNYNTMIKKNIIIGLFICQNCIISAWGSTVGEKKDFYFFSKQDEKNIRLSAKVEWGKEIIKDMEEKVVERRKHSLEVPVKEGGHFHHYFCPKHNLLFTFDWNKPNQHYCSACGKDWAGVERYDRAWIYMLHMKNRDYMVNCTYLYLATGRKEYAGYIRDMLLDYAARYPNYKVHDAAGKETYQHSGKAFAQSLDESSWATDIAMVYGAIKKTLIKKEKEIIENGYLKPAVDLLLHRPAEGNWQMWLNSGLAALGVALEKDSIIEIAVNQKEGYRNTLKRHLNKDGWINEGSPHYHYYPLEALLKTAEAVRCRNINLYDEDMHAMFVEPVKGVYPDLSFPAHSDGWYGANLLSQSALYEIANVRLHDPLLQEVLEKIYAGKKRLDPAALLSGKAIPSSGTPLIQKSYLFDTSGFCLHRSGDKTVVLKYSGNERGHEHPDKLSFTLHNGKTELVSDFGTSGYGIPDYLKWYKRTLSHSTVLVDAKDQKNKKGKLIAFDDTHAAAEIDEAYPGVKMIRKMKLSGNLLKDTFMCESTDEHLYEYVIMFNEKPLLQGEGTAILLNDSEVHQCIQGTMVWHYQHGFICHTPSAEITFELPGIEEIEVVLGKASGIPSNPTVNDGPGAGDMAVRPCYPLIIRVKGKCLNVNASWMIH